MSEKQEIKVDFDELPYEMQEELSYGKEVDETEKGKSNE